MTVAAAVNDDFDPEALTEDEQTELAELLEANLGGESLADWITRVFPHEPPQPHLMPIIEAIEKARARPIRICLSMPPGHSKTTTLLRAMVWWLLKSPADTCAYLSYNNAQARSKSRIARDIALDVGIKLAGSSKSLSEWRTVEGGGMLAAGARGKLQGQRVPGLVVIDDPYKDAKDAMSAVIREDVFTQVKAVAFTRLQGGSIIVLHTRWHEDDLIGRILRELGWMLINVPAVAENDNDIVGRKEGEAAWPSEYPVEECTGACGHSGHLNELKRTLGEYLWWALYMGKPRPKGKAVFHEPARFELKNFKWDGKRGVIAIDPAATAKTSSDWSVLLVCAMEGFGPQSKMYLVDRVRVQVEIPDLVTKHARPMQLRFRLLIACEAVGGFKAVPQSLRAIDPGVDEDGKRQGKLRVLDIDTTVDKFLRAQAYAAAWNDSRVMVPTDVHWADEFIREHRIFTGVNDPEDDQVDAGAHGWNTLYRESPAQPLAWEHY